MAMMTTESTFMIGQLWQGQTRHHRWLVDIRGVTTAAVLFECLRGPGKTRKTRQRLRKDIFLAAYQRVG